MPTREKLTITSLMLPAIVVVFGLSLFPTIFTVAMSFCDVKPATGFAFKFEGLVNYEYLISDPRIPESLQATAIFSFAALCLEFIIGLPLALLLNKEIKGKAFFIAALLPPMMIPPVAVGLMWRVLLNARFGPVNHILESLGILGILGGEAPLWHAGPKTALLTIVLVDAWQWIPFVTLVLLASLVSIPKEVTDMATVDGVSDWQMARYIQLPMIKTGIILVLLLRMVDLMKEYDKIFVMTYGGPGTATQVLNFYIYIVGFRYLRISRAAAYSIFSLLIATVLIALLIKIIPKK